MKILYINFVQNVWGHKRLDSLLIEYLSTFAEVTVVSPENWYQDLPKNVNIVNYDPSKLNAINSSRKYHYYSFKLMNFASMLDKIENFDYIIAATFNTINFAISPFLFKNPKRIYIIHHNNTDQLTNKKAHYFFSSYAKKVNHIVFNEFIGSFLKEKYKINNIVVLPHPLYKNDVITKSRDTLYTCVGLSNSNDEDVIKQIIYKEKDEKVFQTEKINVVLRSKESCFNNGYLNVINGYLKTTEYDFYINNSYSIFLPFPKSFRYRMSGTLMDALSNRKIVLGTNIPLLQNYSKRYPKICYIVKDIDDFIEKLQQIQNINYYDLINEFERFEQDHSPVKIINILKEKLKKS